MESVAKKSGHLWPLIFLAAVLGVLLSQPALAVTKQWVGPHPDNLWTNANNWSPAGPPVADDFVDLAQSDARNRTVVYDSLSNPLLPIVTIDATGAGTITLEQSANSLLTNVETIGDAGKGNYIQSGGTNTANSAVILGNGVGSSGTYTLQGGSLSTFSGKIGVAGSGSFTQSGGSNTTASLGLGIVSTGNGTFTLQNGSLAVQFETIGFSGTGSFTQKSGTHTVSVEMDIGTQSDGMGTYNLQGGSLSVSGIEEIGLSGTGRFLQTGGTHTTGDGLILGDLAGSNGTYELRGGSLLTNRERIGNEGTGTFIQSGGTHVMTPGTFVLGFSSGGSGTYKLTGGSLSVMGGLSIASETIGSGGTGTFIQSGGTHAVSNAVAQGIALGSSIGSGTYTLSGGSLSAVSESLINGSFTQSGGTNAVNGLSLGRFESRLGTYDLKGGSLSASSESVGNGTFTQSGGANSAGTLGISQSFATGSSSYTLKGGSLSATDETIGSFGPGSFSQAGGSNMVSGTLFLGRNSGSGTYDLKGGNLTAAYEIIGGTATGIFTQTGSNHTVMSDLTLGNAATGSGAFTLKGGNLSVGGFENIGYSGSGSFTQIGGIHTVNPQNTVNGGLNLGLAGSGSGTYDLKGGLLSVGGAETIGFDGVGSFTQNSGNNKTGNLLLGGSGGSGTYDLKSGNLSTSDEFIGNTGSGTFTQTSGNHTVANLLSLGDVAGSHGTYNLSGGILTAADEIVAHGLAGGSTGVFNQTGGINTVADTLTLGGGTATSGTYNYLGGILSARAIQINAGGAFNITGIKPTITSNVANSGTVRTTNAAVTWKGNFPNNGAYISDHSQQTFSQNLLVGTTGYLVGLTSQDLFLIKNDFVNQSAQNTLWNTVNAGLKFITNPDQSHEMYITGQGDSGADNFAWYTLDITGQTLRLKDGNATANGDQWLQVLIGAKFTGTTLTNIFNNDPTNILNLYYDKNLAANAYLGGLDYTITGGAGGQLIAHTPLPPAVLLMGSGLLGLGLLGWRRRRLIPSCGHGGKKM